MTDREKRLAEIADGMKYFNQSKGYAPTRATAPGRAPVPPTSAADPKAARLEELKATARAVAVDRGYGARNVGD